MFDDVSTIVGSFCTLITPYKGYTEGVIEDEYGTDVLVRLSSGKELTVCRSDLIIYND
jgi:hypothetical protein